MSTIVITDWTDPCARAAALTTAYYQTLAGDREVEIRTRSLDAEDHVRYRPTDLAALRVEMQAAQAECAALNGAVSPNRRFALTAGRRSDIPAWARDNTPVGY